MQPKKVREGVWEFRREGMNAPARIYANQKILSGMEEGVFKQISNVACLPGIRGHACIMPDGHYGYGFPIGGVAGFDLTEGVISPGGVGYDINCGVRLLATDLDAKTVSEKKKKLIDDLFTNIPSGLGSKSRLRLNKNQLGEACTRGAQFILEEGMGVEEDLAHTEEAGCIKGADYDKVGERAKKRGLPQIGTLGSGNHFLEIQEVSEIIQPEKAQAYGLTHEGQVTVMIHCGSRGLGYQIADDYIKVMLEASRRQNIDLPDQQLACAYLESREARDYLAAMYCAVNYAFANRQAITHWVRETLQKHYPGTKVRQVYDVCHNIAKIEEHEGHGRLCVHRKGATRAFAPGRNELPKDYRKTGQPAIVPGDMGTASYVLSGTQSAMRETFGSICHGAGRVMSRAKAKRSIDGRKVEKMLSGKGKYVRAASMDVLAEENPGAYKNVVDVIESVETAGLAEPVVKLNPLGVVKG